MKIYEHLLCFIQFEHKNPCPCTCLHVQGHGIIGANRGSNFVNSSCFALADLLTSLFIDASIRIGSLDEMWLVKHLTARFLLVEKRNGLGRLAELRIYRVVRKRFAEEPFHLKLA